MTYEEFKDKVEALGLCIKDKGSLIRIKTKGDYYVADVNKEKEFEICTEPLATLGDSKEKILDLCYQLAKTPLEEREPVKKYYLKHKFIRSLDRQTYLTKNEKYFWLTTEIETDETYADYQQFTLAEIENIEEKFGVTLEDWELVEVEE